MSGDTSFFELNDLLNELDDVIQDNTVPVLIISVMGVVSVGYRGDNYAIFYELSLGDISNMENVIENMNKLIIKTRK